MRLLTTAFYWVLRDWLDYERRIEPVDGILLRKHYVYSKTNSYDFKLKINVIPI